MSVAVYRKIGILEHAWLYSSPLGTKGENGFIQGIGRHTEEFPFGYTQSLMQAIQSKDGILPWRFLGKKCSLTEIWASGGQRKKTEKPERRSVYTRCGQGMGFAGFPFFTKTSLEKNHLTKSSVKKRRRDVLAAIE